ncbi:hypothetical protein Taro_051789, partial [Colocasia esculenta]|nr:hypothetical protein [Colocasia esculenta]
MEQIRKATLNWSVMNIMQCTIHPKEYSRLIYEGTFEVKETKASMLVFEYELFKMKHDETISKIFARFIIIFNGLKGIGRDYSNNDFIRK